MNTSSTKIAALFDLDGVLIDSETIYTEIWTRINEKFPTGVQDFPRRIKGTTLDNILDTYFPNPEIRPKVIEMLYDEEGKMKYRFCPGAEQFLITLREKNVAMALVTSSNGDKMSGLFRQLPHLKDFFDTIIVGEMVKHSKPDPEGYLLAAKRLGADPRNCAVFEDSLQGVKAGRAAGAYVIGDAGTLPAETLQPYSDIVVDSLEEIDIDNLIHSLSLR
ncbi:MAG: HAD family phosphatase [Muribaculaceae bacterium]|nr:HAD family phosphatase [Muribaculaceae bacterium]